ncbi:hypothetical protein HY949_02990, partial [Candidatus Gottesmanbacteria bacterium]|nr:hypothetical protein [Candidatus Gottesmanbacteria bacterium]
MQVCSCSGLEYGPTTAICTQNCVKRNGSINCQDEANNSCKVIQIDVLNNSGLVDTIVCTPDTNKCGGTTTQTNTSTNQQTNTSTTTTTTTATSTPTPTGASTPTPTPGPTCETIRVYDSAGTDITASLKTNAKKLAIGEAVTLATLKG